MVLKSSKTFFIKSLFITGLSVVLFACGTTTNEGDASGSDTTTTQDNSKTKAQTVFYAIPSPIETASLLKKAGAVYHKEYLNPVENLSKYTSTGSKALNLGVYGADLSFTSIFDQTQQSILYLKCSNNLAEGLGISGAFGEKTLSRVEANLGNRDSLLLIVSDAFWASDSYLKENGRPNTSALIISGGWIEGLYLATKIAQTTNNEAVIKRIGEQKLSLDNLISLIESFESDENINLVLTDLKELKTIYDGVETTKSKTETVTDKKSGITTIGNNSRILLNKDQLKAISDKIQGTRNKIIK